MTRTPGMPNDQNAERAVLGSVLLDNRCWHVAADVLQADDFYADRHALIWNAMEVAMRSSGALDTDVLRSQLALAGTLARAGGDEYLLALTDTIPTVANIEAHARRIRDLAAARAVVAAALELAAEGQGDVDDLQMYLDRAESALTVACARRTARAKVVSLSDAITSSYQQLVARAESGSKLRGYATGLVRVDRLLGGLSAGDVIVLAARPGMGKSALAQRMALGVSSVAPVLVFSLEMPTDTLADRMLAAEGGVDLRCIRNASINREQWTALTSAAGRLESRPIHFVDEPALTVLDVRREARRFKRARGGQLGLVVIDYLQLLRSGRRTESREQEVSEISRALKSLAKELAVPVLALSQLNRRVDERADKRPLLSDLRESGSIEQDADAVCFIYRDDEYDADSSEAGIAEIIVAKHRNGPTGMVKLRFSSEHTRFDNLAETDSRTAGGEPC